MTDEKTESIGVECQHCEEDEWFVYEPDDGIADIWFECSTDNCTGVKFAPGVAE